MISVSMDKLTQRAQERGEPFKILIVDDEPWIRDVFKDFCSFTDAFHIDLAATGNEAVEKAAANKYDLITMDLIMPDRSGLDALIEIKRVSPRVPIMVITGNATDRLVTQAGVMGACRVLYKPVLMEDFIAELTSALVK